MIHMLLPWYIRSIVNCVCDRGAGGADKIRCNCVACCRFSLQFPPWHQPTLAGGTVADMNWSSPGRYDCYYVTLKLLRYYNTQSV